jgi:hypothetical protein
MTAIANHTNLYQPAARLTPEELVAEAIRCIITGREFPEHLRAPSAMSPGLASVHQRIAAILAGPVGL